MKDKMVLKAVFEGADMRIGRTGVLLFRPIGTLDHPLIEADKISKEMEIKQGIVPGNVHRGVVKITIEKEML